MDYLSRLDDAETPDEIDALEEIIAQRDEVILAQERLVNRLVSERAEKNELINSLRAEVAQLRRELKKRDASIGALETEDLHPRRTLYSPGERGHQPARKGKSTW